MGGHCAYFRPCRSSVFMRSWSPAVSSIVKPSAMSFRKEYACRPGPVVTRPGAYDTATKGIVTYDAEYSRLRTNSGCDPFLGLPNAENEFLLISGSPLNDPFGHRDEQYWMECFTDLSSYEACSDNIVEEVEKAAAEVDWEQWDRFLSSDGLCGDHSLIGSGGSSPLSSSSSDEYVPNFDAVCCYTAVLPSAKKDEQPSFGVRVKQDTPPMNQSAQNPPTSRKLRSIVSRPPKMRYLPVSEHSKRAEFQPEQRRRELNRDAALRYRERKKAEVSALKREAQELEERNLFLRSRASLLDRELKRMRAHLKDVGAL